MRLPDLESMKHTLFLIALLSAPALAAQNFHVLYGFKIGQPILAVKAELGEPTKVHAFEDGFKAYIYQLKGQNVIFETDNKRPDLVWSVQLAGDANTAERGLGPVNLGDTAEAVKKALGKPDSEKDSIDGVTKKPVPGLRVLDYFESRNVSLETEKGKVASIKIVFKPIRQEKRGEADLPSFLKAVNAEDRPGLCNRLSIAFAAFTKSKGVTFQKSCTAALAPGGDLADFFYGAGGLKGIKGDACSQGALRVHETLGPGPVFRCKRPNKEPLELFFVMSYDGWTLGQLVDPSRD